MLKYKYDCNQEQWKDFISTMHTGDKFEVDQEMFYYWLEVLPPIFMNREITFLPGHEGHPMYVSFGFAEGAEPITVFWKAPGREQYFGQRTNKINNC